jgi:hypothetical protein
LANSALGGTPRGDLLALPELELYMPIPEHLKIWRGGASVQVAVPIKRDEAYVIYSLDGSSRRVRGDYIPFTPTLVLGKSELDYDDQESALKGGSRTGDMMRAAAAIKPQFSLGSSSALGISTAQHTRLAAFYLYYQHDGGLAGSDEVEVFGAMVTWFHVGGQYRECTRATGIEDHTHYTMLDNSGRTIATAVPTSGSTDDVYIHAYEDDNEGCVFHAGDDDFYGKIDMPRVFFGYNIVTYRDSGAKGHIEINVRASTP